MGYRLQSPILPPTIQPPAPNKDQLRFNRKFSAACLGLVLAGGCMAGGSIGPGWD